MENYIKFKTTLLKYHIVFSIIVLSLFYSLNLIKEANGFILGAFISLVNFFLLARTNEKILVLKDKFESYSKRWFFLRYLLFALALIISFKKSYISLSGTIIGLFSIQLAIFCSLILGKLRD